MPLLCFLYAMLFGIFVTMQTPPRPPPPPPPPPPSRTCRLGSHLCHGGWQRCAGEAGAAEEEAIFDDETSECDEEVDGQVCGRICSTWHKLHMHKVRGHQMYCTVQRFVLTKKCPHCGTVFSSRVGAQHHALRSAQKGECYMEATVAPHTLIDLPFSNRMPTVSRFIVRLSSCLSSACGRTASSRDQLPLLQCAHPQRWRQWRFPHDHTHRKMEKEGSRTTT